jgi:acetyl-CoA carboxylase biotin carboxyl carrier protein
MSTDLTHEDVRKIVALVDAAQSLEEIEIVYGGFRLHVSRGGGRSTFRTPESPREPAAAAVNPGADVVTATTSARLTEQRGQEPIADGAIAIRAPMLGTFYRSPSPGEPPFVEIGQRVRADDTVCLIEVMKLFSSIRAGVDGVVTGILAENGSMVEYNQPLIVITPASAS